LANRAGLSRETISNVECGAIPRLGTARKIARALGADVANLFPEDEGSARANGTLPSESQAVAAAGDVPSD